MIHQLQSAPGATVLIDGREYDYFCGTGYYSLQSHPDLIDAAYQAMQQYGISSATSRAGFGNNPVLLAVEAAAARFFGTEQSLYTVSGYLGSAMLLQGLRDHYEVIFADQASHYSINDGAAIAGKPIICFKHCSAEDLVHKIQSNLKPGQRPLVITDGVFPTMGVIPPLVEYDQVLSGYEGALLCVDDAHATGVIGKLGRGSLEFCGVDGEGRYASGTCSKALGGHGGIIAGSEQFINTLKKHSPIYIGSNPVPIPAAAATCAGAGVCYRGKPQLREQLWANVAYAKQGFRQMGFDSIP